MLALDREPFATRHEHGDARAPAQDLVDEARRGIEHVLAVVEHEQPFVGRERVGDPPAQREPHALFNRERFGDDDLDGRGVGGCELAKPHRRSARLEPTSRFARHPRLADPARPDERDETHRGDAFDDRRNQVVSTDEDVRRERHARGGATLGRARHGAALRTRSRRAAPAARATERAPARRRAVAGSRHTPEMLRRCGHVHGAQP